MKNRIRDIITAVLCLQIMAGGYGAAGAETAAGGVTFPVSRDPDLGSTVIGIRTEDFNALGFEYGDSCDVLFSTGYSLQDIPYYDGYYTRTGEPQICAYPGYESPVVAINSGEPVWTAAGLSEGDTVTVTLREKGKYLQIQQSLEMVYSLDRADYADDETFVNFRPLAGGQLAENRVYRGASPVDNRMRRAGTADRLLAQNGIRFVLDLADTEETLKAFRAQEGFDSPHFMGLHENGQALLLGLNNNFRGEAFRHTLADALRAMAQSEGPAYIHCLEGKDRTGFVCMLLEALAGASYEEILADYMATYRNYYGITEETTPEKYQAVVSVKFNDLLQMLTGLPDGSDYGGTVLRDSARQYLLDSGMTETEVDGLTDWLTRK